MATLQGLYKQYVRSGRSVGADDSPTAQSQRLAPLTGWRGGGRHWVRPSLGASGGHDWEFLLA